MPKNYRVTLKYPDGTTMFMGTVMAEEVTAELPAQPLPASNDGGGPRGGVDEHMTDPQKRYLFRLLAAQNVTGKAAEEHLKQYFKVQKLTDISRQAASEYIDRLVKDKKDAAAS